MNARAIRLSLARVSQVTGNLLLCVTESLIKGEQEAADLAHPNLKLLMGHSKSSIESAHRSTDSSGRHDRRSRLSHQLLRVNRLLSGLLPQPGNKVFDIEVSRWPNRLNPALCASQLDISPRPEIFSVHSIVRHHGRERVLLGRVHRQKHEAVHGAENMDGLIEHSPALPIKAGAHDLPRRHKAQGPLLIHDDDVAVPLAALLGDIHDHVLDTILGVPEPLLDIFLAGLLQNTGQLRPLRSELALCDLAGEMQRRDVALGVLDRVAVSRIEPEKVRSSLFFREEEVTPNSEDGRPASGV